MRKLPLALACALIFGSSSAFAMGLGELQTQSNLNQPLRVTIPITDVRPGDLDALSVKIGDEAQFARHGYSLMSVYGRIKLQIVGGQRPHILLTSDAPVRDPVLGLVLEVEGPSGTIERAVSILLDPEGYKPLAMVKSASGRAAVQSPVSDVQPRDQIIYATERPSTQRRPASAQELLPIKDGGDYTAVSGDTAYNIAQRVKPDGVSLQQTIGMILQNNPQAFANPADAGTLLAGKTLTIPNAQAMRQAPRPATAVASKSAPAGATPAAPAAAQEPRLDIVQPTVSTTPSTPVIAAPVVGEVVSSGTAGAPDSASAAVSQATPQAAVIPAEVQEQIEASKVENERLTGLLASQDQRLQKMEELLRLNETLIKEMEQKMNAAPAVPTVPVAAPVEAATPWWSFLLMGLGALLAAVLAFVAGSRRRARSEPDAAVESSVPGVMLDKRADDVVSEPEIASPVAMPVAATAAASVAADVIEDSADPIKAALEEADVMQAYGLHDRATQVLSDALQAQPGNAVLMARRARAMHEAGDAEGFLREAQAFREQHPGDEEQWAELRALGEAHYPTSPLFGAAATASVLDGEMNPWAQPSFTPAEADEASALFQPLDSLDLGAPDAALDELLNSQAAVQAPAAGLDMPPLELDMPLLELDLPVVPSLDKAPDEVAYALDTAASENIADVIDDWAPLELPGAGDVQPVLDMKDASSTGGAPEVSEDDLAILGIDTLDDDVSALMPVAAGVQLVEPDFAEDMKAAQSEMAALDLEAISLPLADAEAVADEGADESFNIDLMDFEPLDLAPVPPPASESVHDALALSLDLESAHTAAVSSAIEPLELPLDLPLSAPVSSLQETLSAPMLSSGMVSEHEVKLDIASAYIDMGDHAGAREMLQEVLASNGDELLKSRANQMLASLSA